MNKKIKCFKYVTKSQGAIVFYLYIDRDETRIFANIKFYYAEWKNCLIIYVKY